MKFRLHHNHQITGPTFMIRSFKTFRELREKGIELQVLKIMNRMWGHQTNQALLTVWLMTIFLVDLWTYQLWMAAELVKGLNLQDCQEEGDRIMDNPLKIFWILSWIQTLQSPIDKLKDWKIWLIATSSSSCSCWLHLSMTVISTRKNKLFLPNTWSTRKFG